MFNFYKFITMKKLFFIAALAVAFMACENSAEMPKKEQKALQAATTEVVSMIGQADQATVDKALVAAGFQKVDRSGYATVVARRAKANMKKALKEDGTVTIVYAYNLPENYQDMDEEQATKYVKDLFANGDGYITASVSYKSGVLYATSTVLMTGIREKVNVSYAKVSDDLYGALPKGLTKEWEGGIMTDPEKEAKQYTDHAEYVAAVAAAQEVQASEFGHSVTGTNGSDYAGKLYQTYWINPDKEMQAEMIEEFGAPYAYGAFTVADLAALSE